MYGDVKIEKLDGKENATYPFTKALGINVFDKHKCRIGLKYMIDLLSFRLKILDLIYHLVYCLVK
ncbi:hypothetical protein MTR_7g066470 [Medicago truncatula]|uniref:Uncharacterized protein n=1 Tax=Medicago truncatula TaxID=3880 RepID=A0A072U0Y5_MEDTR|nr:hypothetical protein MTR_7g066470 [Medicago truncatula]